MLKASCSLELPERVLTKSRNPEETEDVTASGSSKEASNSGVSRESVRVESPSLVQSQPWPGPEKNNPHNLVPGESGLMMTPYK